jgi:hypothetical protein
MGNAQSTNAFDDVQQTRWGESMFVGWIQMNGITDRVIPNHHCKDAAWLQYSFPFLNRLNRILVVLQIVPLDDIIQALVTEHGKPVCRGFHIPLAQSSRQVARRMQGFAFDHQIDAVCVRMGFAMDATDVDAIAPAQREEGQSLGMKIVCKVSA